MDSPRPTILWRDPEPARVRALFEALGLRAAPDGTIDLPSASVAVVEAPIAGAGLSVPEPNALPDGSIVLARSWPASGVDVLAVGWATVDLDRAARDLPGLALAPAEPDAHLGARALVDRARRPTFALLEPNTEGRVAAALARRGEGPVAIYLAVSLDVRLDAGGLSARMRGPFGWTRLVLGGPPWGPHLLVVDRGPADDTSLGPGAGP